MVDHLAGRPFAFYPPIHNLEHNEWQFRKVTWSEVVAINRRTNISLSVPRRFVAEISDTGDPFVIVGLAHELEYRDGALWPYRRSVIEMPLAVGEGPAPSPVARRTPPAPVVAIRLESGRDHRYLKVAGGAMVLALAACVHIMALNLIHAGEIRAHAVNDHSYLNLNGADTYTDVVRKLGGPASDRWMAASQGLEYRALGYPARHFTAILLGSDRASAAYIGALDSSGHPIEGVRLANGSTTFPLLRNLKPF